MEPHNCCRDTKKLYLSAELNLSVMYKLYCDNVSKPVYQSVYSKIFHNYDPHLVFYNPKKKVSVQNAITITTILL